MHVMSRTFTSPDLDAEEEKTKNPAGFFNQSFSLHVETLALWQSSGGSGHVGRFTAVFVLHEVWWLYSAAAQCGITSYSPFSKNIKPLHPPSPLSCLAVLFNHHHL